MIADFEVSDNCWNFNDSYGMICVRCGCCSEDKEIRYKGKWIAEIEDCPKEGEIMTLEEAKEGLRYLISDDCTDSQFDYVDEIEMAIKFLELWDEVLKELNDEANECEFYRDVWGAIGLEKAIRIIEKKLKEVEE